MCFILVLSCLSSSCVPTMLDTLYDQCLSVTCGRSGVVSGFLHQLNDIQEITEMLLKVALNTIRLTGLCSFYIRLQITSFGIIKPYLARHD